MTLLFDTKVEFLDSDAVCTIGSWHSRESLFAVAFQSPDRGGSISIFIDTGELRHDVAQPIHPTSQCTALSWHPDRILLASGWENGDLYIWFEGHREFVNISGPHKSAITLLEFSEQGGRMVTTDSTGLLTGWRCDSQYQFFTLFTHDLRLVFKYITFRRTICNETREEMLHLAKAAVSGDENALDTLTNWRPRTAIRSLTNTDIKDNYCFFASTRSGLIYYVNQSGTCNEISTGHSTPVTQMLWHPKKDAVICLMEDVTIILYLVETTGILTELHRIKLICKISTTNINRAITWVGCSLAIIMGDLTVRIWDIESSENYLLKTDIPKMGIESNQNHTTSGGKNYNQLILKSNEYFTCMTYVGCNQRLIAGTNFGNLYTWKRCNERSTQIQQPEDMWQLINISNIGNCASIKQCKWGFNVSSKPCFLVISMSDVYILKEQPLLACYLNNICMVQENARNIVVMEQNEMDERYNCTLKAEFCVTVLALTTNNLCISNGRLISTYNIEKSCNNTSSKDNPQICSKLHIKLLQTFTAECFSLSISNMIVFCLNSKDIIMFSIGGVALHKIESTSNEGKIIGMDLSNTFLSIFTMNGYIKAYDVSHHDPMLFFPSKCGYDMFDNFGEVIQIKCNSLGTHLALIIANRSFVPHPIIYCWDFEHNYLMNIELNKMESKNISYIPVFLCWDNEESQLFALEVKSVQTQEIELENYNHYIRTDVWIIFYNESNKLNILETIILDANEQLLHLCIPKIITLNVNMIRERLLCNFSDLKNCDSNIREKVLKFSMYAAENNMDMAYRSIRSLHSPAIWTSLAKMCVTTCRLDVAKVCLSHLKKAQSVRALNEALDDDDLDIIAKTAILATELGLYDEAKALYKKCQRFDLLNKHLRRSGNINEALNLAEMKDRMHIKNVYYHKANEYREKGNITKALEYYEKTHNPVHNVTQLLLENPTFMKHYMQNTTDSKMLKWWGQYIESSGDMDAALAIYQKAEDWYSQVKILCYLGKISKADAIARQSGDRAACYHLARHFENMGKYQDAINFYTRAQTYGNAIRICKENDFQDELWTVANSSKEREKIIAAAYFENCGSFKRAVKLYHRAGLLHKALELAFASEQPDILEIIATELTADSDIELINRCADFFITVQQYQKAVQLLAKTRQLKRSIDICIEKGVPITEHLSEILTPIKGEIDDKTRVYILTQLGELLQQQGDYHAATKKFTQAGDKVRGMKSLLKSGNTEKIIYFANVSRHREVYIMTANYLQALNWQEDDNILKHIITYYSKGQAYDSLANFYAICAQIEIDEYHNYEKALKAMNEAAKCLEKIGGHSQKVQSNLKRTINEVKIILKIQNDLENCEYQIVIDDCRKMLNKPETPPIRQMDIKGMLIKALVYSQQYDEAAKILKELTVRDIEWRSSELIDISLVQKVSEECQLDFDTIWYPFGKNKTTVYLNDNDNDLAICEEIHEDVL